MAKRKKVSGVNNKIVFIVIVIMILVGSVSIGLLYTNYLAEKNYQEAISLNTAEDSNSFDYSGAIVEDTGTEIKVNYSRLGTGFSYQIPVYSNMDVDSDNSEDIPNLKFKNLMPYADSKITFSYGDSQDNSEPNYEGEILSTKQILVDGHPARIVETEEDYIKYGYGGGYRYHVYVVVENVKQATRYSSKNVVISPRIFVIHGLTGDTTDERAREEVLKSVNELVATLKFKES